jgi:hypothetical protein
LSSWNPTAIQPPNGSANTARPSRSEQEPAGEQAIVNHCDYERQTVAADGAADRGCKRRVVAQADCERRQHGSH